MSNVSFKNVEEWKKLAAGGDENAFKALFDHYHPRLFRYVVTIVKSTQVAEELVMDVFLKLWLARDMLTQIDNLDGFLFKIARNKSIDFFQSAARDRKFAGLAWEQISNPAASADSSLLTKEFEDKLRKAIDLLPTQRKKIFNLSREEGLTHLQIAEALGISKTTVANTIVEAKRFIQAYLGKNLYLLLFLLLILPFLGDE